MHYAGGALGREALDAADGQAGAGARCKPRERARTMLWQQSAHPIGPLRPAPMARRIFAVIGRTEMIEDTRFCTNAARVKHRIQVDEAAGAWFATRTRDEALTAMRAASVTAGPVYTIADAASDTHFRDRGIIVEVEDRELGVLPCTISCRAYGRHLGCGAGRRAISANTRTRCSARPGLTPMRSPAGAARRSRTNPATVAQPHKIPPYFFCKSGA
jgi:hypothetical protein